MSDVFIHKSLLRENRSVWTAQREGRTKDGNDLTQKGVLKMLTLAIGDIHNGVFQKVRLGNILYKSESKEKTLFGVFHCFFYLFVAHFFITNNLNFSHLDFIASINSNQHIY